MTTIPHHGREGEAKKMTDANFKMNESPVLAASF
jgi:hypothetical protein